MDSTEILQLQESLERALEAQARERQLREIGLRMLEAGQGPREIGRAALEGLLASLDFERAFLLLSEPAAAPDPEGQAGGEPAPFKVLAARCRSRRGNSRGGDFEDIANSDFALNRPAARRAFQSLQVLVLNDCLAEPQEAEQEVHRSVLCQPFMASPDRPAVIYLDRALGSQPVEKLDLSLLADFSERCLPILARGFLCQEVLELRARAARPGEPDPRLAAAGPQGQTVESEDVEEEEEPAPAPGPGAVYQGIVGGSERMRRIFQVIEKIKDSELNVCIFGESGTGKELVARAIHAASRRRDHRFVSENCGTIAETLLESELFGHQRGAFTGADEDHQGLFQTASGGTLFLDEIGDMSEGMQRKLLRVLQEGVVRPLGSKQTLKVDARVICASNRNLPALVKSGAFRMDLFYRVNVISIDLPPLRERMEDLPLLAAHFVEEIRREEGEAPRLSEGAMKALAEYGWPGNVRELRNVIRRAAVTCSKRTVARKDVIPLLTGTQASGFLDADLTRTDGQIMIRIPRRETFNEIIGECERVVLQAALKECRWNKSKVVKTMKIPRQSLYNMISKHDLRRKWED